MRHKSYRSCMLCTSTVIAGDGSKMVRTVLVIMVTLKWIKWSSWVEKIFRKWGNVKQTTLGKGGYILLQWSCRKMAWNKFLQSNKINRFVTVYALNVCQNINNMNFCIFIQMKLLKWQFQDYGQMSVDYSFNFDRNCKGG